MVKFDILRVLETLTFYLAEEENLQLEDFAQADFGREIK